MPGVARWRGTVPPARAPPIGWRPAPRDACSRPAGLGNRSPTAGAAEVPGARAPAVRELERPGRAVLVGEQRPSLQRDGHPAVVSARLEVAEGPGPQPPVGRAL